MLRNLKPSLYWKCQLAGWSLASLYWLLNAMAFSKFFDPLAGLVHFILDVLIGIAITHGYRMLDNRYQWHRLQTGALLRKLIPAVLVMAMLYAVLISIKLYLINTYLIDPADLPPVSSGMRLTFFDFVHRNGVVIFMTGLRLCSIWVLAYHLYRYAVREIKTTRENARLALMAKESQLNNLSAQLNPHFLFNSLNNIKALVSERPDDARRAIDLLSDLLRNALYRKNELMIPLGEELELVKDYLELEKMRFEDRMQTVLNTSAELESIPVPPLCLQMLVENAIKHGLSHKIAGGLIGVNLEKEQGFLRMDVVSPGLLDTGWQGKGLGLKNLSERLALQYDGRAKFELRTTSETTVTATLMIPLT